MNTVKLTVLTAVWVTLIAACGSSNTKINPSAPCDSGDWIDIAQERACVFQQPITETRFRCPPELPFLYHFETNLFVCSPADFSGSDIEERLVEDGFLPPPLIEEPDVREPPFGEPSVEEPEVVEPEVVEPSQEPSMENSCEEGTEIFCLCDQDIPGVQTCDNGELTTCICEGEWSAPAVNEVQERPVACSKASAIASNPANIDNTEIAPGPCLVEEFIQGCSIAQIHFTYEGEKTTSKELILVNDDPALIEQSNNAHEYNNSYRHTWIYNEEEMSEQLLQDVHIDGTIDARSLYEFNTAGQVVYSELHIQEDIFGPSSRVTNITYNEQGLFLRSETRVTNENGELQTLKTQTYTEHDQPLEMRLTRNGELKELDIWTYNEQGLPDFHEQRLSNSHIIYTTLHYSENNTLEREFIREFSEYMQENGDPATELRVVKEYFYDEQGHKIRQTIDNQGDGFEVDEWIWAYDEQGLLEYESIGRVGEEQPNQTKTHTYNEEGLLFRTVRQEFHTDTQEVDTRLYNARGQLMEQQTVDSNTGELLYAQHKEWAESGRERPLLSESDFDGDGIWDSRLTWSYDAAEQLLDEQWDRNADGFIETRTAYRYQCQPR